LLSAAKIMLHSVALFTVGMSLRLSSVMEMSLEMSVSWGVKLRMSLSKGVHVSLSIGMVMIIVLSDKMLNLVSMLVQATQVEVGAGDAQGCGREEGEERDAVDHLHGNRC
jgi:hypothetical protein